VLKTLAVVSGFDDVAVVRNAVDHHIKRPAFASRAIQSLVRLIENPITHFRTPFLLVKMPPFGLGSIVVLIFH